MQDDRIRSAVQVGIPARLRYPSFLALVQSSPSNAVRKETRSVSLGMEAPGCDSLPWRYVALKQRGTEFQKTQGGGGEYGGETLHKV